jgi:anti-anti-sigma regulatory factor
MDLQVVELMRTLPELSRGRVILDLRRVTFMDAAWLGAVVSCHRRAHSVGGCLRLTAPPPRRDESST